MDQQSLSTPSATPSGDSTKEAISYEPPSPIVISSSSSEPDEFKPHQMLMQTPITIECGKNLSEKLTVHEELLCCHSRLLEQRFFAAKDMRQQYEQAKTLRDQMAAYVFPEVTKVQFEARSCEKRALPLIIRAYDSYPFPDHVKDIRKKIDEETGEQVRLKKVKARMLQTAIREEDWKVRIMYIDSRGVHAIIGELFGLLHRLNKQEIVSAREDPVRAAAQKRILLPGVEKNTAELVMQWVYQGKFECKNPQQLYNTLQLATQLGIEALSEICLTRLYNAAHDSIQNAMMTGITLKSLLGYGPGPSDNMVGVIFKHALQDHDTPQRIQDLVVHFLATELDTELWAKLKDLANHSITVQIIDAMLGYRQQVGKENPDDNSIKPEDDFTKYEHEEVHEASPIHLKDG
ncbi:hypothetical protein yc1106_06293 [Curvularia clavata]|uniref:BTB domain-containing protein n=1 Tax=Curvularia clavata TaxID=95742 RepID=A0A9Q8ZAI3_CURCL|nr:hypothetical protein yc1106_06293 [Curvularia clavata]